MLARLLATAAMGRLQTAQMARLGWVDILTRHQQLAQTAQMERHQQAQRAKT
jgi:hypothetical protein